MWSDKVARVLYLGWKVGHLSSSELSGQMLKVATLFRQVSSNSEEWTAELVEKTMARVGWGCGRDDFPPGDVKIFAPEILPFLKNPDSFQFEIRAGEKPITCGEVRTLAFKASIGSPLKEADMQRIVKMLGEYAHLRMAYTELAIHALNLFEVGRETKSTQAIVNNRLAQMKHLVVAEGKAQALVEDGVNRKGEHIIVADRIRRTILNES